MKNTQLSLLAFCSDLPQGINVKNLESYLLFMPGSFESAISDYQAKLISHFQEVITVLTKNVITNQELIEKEQEHLRSIGVKTLECPTSNPFIRQELLKYRILAQKNIALDLKLESNNLSSLQHLNKVLNDLLLLTKWLLIKPRLIFINIKRAMPTPSALTYAADQHLFREHRAIRLALKSQINLINTYPPFFNLVNENRNFVRSAVDTAMGNRKGNTSYFEESAIEDSLFAFFDASSSPLAKAKLIPITVPNDFQSICGWLTQAIDVVVKYDNIENTERKDVIAVYLTRYLFNKLYPRVKPNSINDLPFSRVMQHFARLNPEENHIPAKYVPEAYKNRPVADFFMSSSVTKAPKEWLMLAQFKVCPLDVAYCIFKVHESLSIMVTLQASDGQETQDFFSKMPGFDDIIDVWIALVCCSDVADPQSLYSFIYAWSRLPGFPSRFMNCTTYLEAAIQQIESHRNEKYAITPSTAPIVKIPPKPKIEVPQNEDVHQVFIPVVEDQEIDIDNPLGI